MNKTMSDSNSNKSTTLLLKSYSLQEETCREKYGVWRIKKVKWLAARYSRNDEDLNIRIKKNLWLLLKVEELNFIFSEIMKKVICNI